MKSTDKSTIEVAGRKFDIPCLPFAQNRIVVPSVSFALKAINRLHGPEKEPLNLTAMDHMYLAVFQAVSYVDPKITRAEFDTWGIHMVELVRAVTTIALQTGVLVRAESVQGGEKEGSKEE